MASAEMEADLEASIREAMPTTLKMPLYTAKKQVLDIHKANIEGFNALCNTAQQIHEHADAEFMTTLDELAKEYIALDAQQRAYRAELERMEGLVARGELTPQILEKLVTVSETPTKFDVTKSDQYKRYCEHAGVELEGDDDEDLVLQESESMRSTICPITQLEMVNPMRNPACGHTYSDAGIRAHLKRSSQCPVAGCPKRVDASNLERDVEMEVLIANKRRTTTQQQSQARRASTANFGDDDEEEEYMVE